MSGRLKSEKTAVLVIHGIGEQNPYETLDQFAGGIFSFLRETLKGVKVKLSLRKRFHETWSEVYVRITAKWNGQPEQHVDVYEYYWAPERRDGYLSCRRSSGCCGPT